MKAVEKRDASGAETEIRALIDEWAQAISDKNVDAVLAHYAEDVVAFDVPPPLQVAGLKAVRTNIENWLKMFEGRPNVEFKDQKIAASGDLGVLHQLARISDDRKGAESGSWVRVTVCRHVPSIHISQLRNVDATYETMSFNFFKGRIFTTLRAGLALKTVSSFVKGLMPLRSFVAGLCCTTILQRPGIAKVFEPLRPTAFLI